MKKTKKPVCCILSVIFYLLSSISAFATTLDYEEAAARRLALPVETNEISSWPSGPVVGAESAILMDADTGTVLYAKNIHARLYPASTTKILTTLVAIENSKLNEMVNFSTEAVFSIERGSSNMGMDVGQSITMEQCLYGILVYSANEVANAVGEHIAGGIDGFVDMMNDRATEIGCENSHFVTTNGLHDDNHYTSAYDLALIAKEFFKNETLAKISGTRYYKIEPTNTQPDLIELYTHNALTNGKYTCEGYIGGKTGYTSIARQTLVTCAEQNGMKLICVVMKEDSPTQYTDSIALFDYGFQNFKKVNVSENEKNYIVSDSDFFENNNVMFGKNETLISINKDDHIVVPKNVAFENLKSELIYDSSGKDDSAVATIQYYYENIPIGTANVQIDTDNNYSYDFESPAIATQVPEDNSKNVIFINVVKIILILLCIIAGLAVIILFFNLLKSYNFFKKRRRKSMFHKSRWQQLKEWFINKWQNRRRSRRSRRKR